MLPLSSSIHSLLDSSHERISSMSLMPPHMLRQKIRHWWAMEDALSRHTKSTIRHGASSLTSESKMESVSMDGLQARPFLVPMQSLTLNGSMPNMSNSTWMNLKRRHFTSCTPWGGLGVSVLGSGFIKHLLLSKGDVLDF